jgi:hypothetical protein
VILDQRDGDRCPYPRPFSWHFAECPAFMPRLHLAADTRGNLLRPHWTCAHLASYRQPSGGFYAGCSLGTTAERGRWATLMKEERLTAVRLARVELSEAIRPQVERLREQVGGVYDPLDSRRRGETRAAWAALTRAFDGFVEANPDLFAAAGIDSSELRRCFAEATAEFAGRPGTRRWQMSAAIVTRYPWPIIAFFRPDLTRETALEEADRAR